MIPALLKMTSTPPQASTTFTIASTCASLLTSQTNVSALPSTLPTTDLTFSSAAVSASGFTSASRTLAPSCRKRMEVSRPMPLVLETSQNIPSSRQNNNQV